MEKKREEDNSIRCNNTLGIVTYRRRKYFIQSGQLIQAGIGELNQNSDILSQTINLKAYSNQDNRFEFYAKKYNRSSDRLISYSVNIFIWCFPSNVDQQLTKDEVDRH